jgi:hypothetical protein
MDPVVTVPEALARACSKGPKSGNFVANFVLNFVEFARFLPKVSDEVCDQGQRSELLGQPLATVSASENALEIAAGHGAFAMH